METVFIQGYSTPDLSNVDEKFIILSTNEFGDKVVEILKGL